VGFAGLLLMKTSEYQPEFCSQPWTIATVSVSLIGQPEASWLISFYSTGSYWKR
jgi:hypothetical protein